MPADETQFCLKIDFRRGQGSPERVFTAMSGLIEACQATDGTLLRTISSRLKPVLLLDDVETGSLTSILRTEFEKIDDEALKSGEIKKVIGGFLVRGKKRLIQWLKEREEITNRAELENLQSDLQQLAAETGVKNLPYYEPVSLSELLGNMEQIQGALAVLKKEDSAYYISDDTPQELNKAFKINAEAVEELITEETRTNTVETYLRIKKPDYLGQSMWEVIYGEHAIDVKITDFDWLKKFQARKVDVRPGDSLDVILKVRVNYGYDGTEVSAHHEAVKVRGVKVWPQVSEAKLLLGEPEQIIRIGQDD